MPRRGRLVVGQTGGMSEELRWLQLVYRVPREPSRLRATVWRRLRALGAVYLHNAVAVLPAAPDTERALRLLRNEILAMGGTAQLLVAAALAGESDIVAAYNAARDEEYVEVIARCGDFLTEIDTETAKLHFSYAELEENDEDLTKLRGWLAKITTRDVLGADRRDEAEQALADAEAALEAFANRVYATETGVAPGNDDNEARA